MEFISNALYDYVVAHSQEEPPLLADLTRQTHLKVLQPRMLSGPLQGRFLSVLAKLLQPKKILEVGTFTVLTALEAESDVAEVSRHRNPELGRDIDSMNGEWGEIGV